jgi:hypothetical protein
MSGEKQSELDIFCEDNVVSFTQIRANWRHSRQSCFFANDFYRLSRLINADE